MTIKKKERADLLLVESGLFESREKAKQAIMAGMVYSKEWQVLRAGEKYPIDTVFRIKGERLPYVSRGGLKLEKALSVFDITVKDKLMLDIGASTGGFTDCALQNGVSHVYALDVGYNQLAWKIRNDNRVSVMERTNFRHVTPLEFPKGLAEFVTIDVSFISLKLIFPVLRTVLKPKSDIIALIKPQFEAGKKRVGKKGVVRDKNTHIDVLEDITNFALESGYELLNLDYSPITGGEGNIEFLLHLKWLEETTLPNKNNLGQGMIIQVVNSAHQHLEKKI